MQRSNILLAAIVGAVILFCGGHADAGPFKRIFKRNRQPATVNYSTPGTCVGPNCNTPGIQANRKGGYEGQLPDSYYANWLAQNGYTGTTVQAPGTTVQTATVLPVAKQALVPTPAEEPEESQEKAEEPTLAEALAQLKASQNLVETVALREQQEARRTAAELRDQMAQQELEQRQERARIETELDKLDYRASLKLNIGTLPSIESAPTPPQE